MKQHYNRGEVPFTWELYRARVKENLKDFWHSSIIMGKILLVIAASVLTYIISQTNIVIGGICAFFIILYVFGSLAVVFED